jgi:hypothetical protein
MRSFFDTHSELRGEFDCLGYYWPLTFATSYVYHLGPVTQSVCLGFLISIVKTVVPASKVIVSILI